METIHAGTPDTTALPDTMSLNELAQRMGVRYMTACELARADRPPAPVFRVGRQYRLSRRAYEALMRARHEPRDR